jgi:PKD repeat protein
MQPSHPSRYPEFVSDQVLTASNLNELFGYLDEQVRMTRTNLIGIGIVCGLEVRVPAGGASVTITKGTGVTSSGYLVTLPGTTYTHYNDEFTAEQERYYDRFVDMDTKKQRFPLFELAEAGAPRAKKPLSAAFLQDKVVLIFVELLEESNKNCDPDSCDDKGITVTVTFRPLLVSVDDAEALLAKDEATGFTGTGRKCLDWPELRLPRYNVPATTLPTSAHILKGFLDVIGDPLLPTLEQTLSAAHSAMKPLLDGALAINPFSGLRQKFDFLFSAAIGTQRLMHVQYFMDVISDLLLAYEELRTVCNRALAVCCPDESLFPRHLLLGSIAAQNRDWRQKFLPSPAVCCGGGSVDELRALLLRLARLLATVDIPVTLNALKRGGVPVRITPSLLGAQPLSERAIPYYYNVMQGTPPLFEAWSHEKNRQGKARTNLSWHAASYNNTDPWVHTPLRFDIERYNFFRIEGHIGMPWQNALASITEIRDSHRLPFDVVALNGDFRSLLAFLREASVDLRKALGERPEQWKRILCLFGDLEAMYDMHAAELRCALCGVMKFFYDVEHKGTQMPPNTAAKASQLLLTCSPGHIVRSDSLGAMFEQWYPQLPKSTTAATPEFFTRANIAAGIQVANPLLLMYWLEKIHEAMPAGLIDLNIADIQTRIDGAVDVATQLHQALQNTTAEAQQSAAICRQLDVVLRVCSAAVFRELFRNMLARFRQYLQSQSFALYAAMRSGIQHKAGVPVGGTFILVYHDSASQSTRLPGRNIVLTAAARTPAASTAARAATNVREKNDAGDSARATTSRNTGIFNASDKLFEISSVKLAGERFIADVFRDVREEDDVKESSLHELVAEIPDGAVIADFFIPGMCTSDCPPINFIVIPPKETPEPTPEVTIAIDAKELCSAQTQPIRVHVSPEGGTLVSDAGGVEPGSFDFVPSTVQMNNLTTREVTLTYTVNDVSASVTVLVFNIPTAAITVTPVPTAANAFAFAANAAFAQSLLWDFGDGNTSTEEKPVHVYRQPGTFAVTLTLVNGPCTQTATAEVTVQAPPQPQAQCRLLAEWQKAFATFDAQTDRLMTTFRAGFRPYPDVRGIFLEFIPTILADTPEVQVQKLVTVLPVQKIMEWLRLLQGMITGSATVNTRHLALELFRILNGLLMFYACVQKGDMHQDPVPTQTAFEFVLQAISAWSNVQPALRAQDRAAIKRLAEDYADEHARISSGQPAKVRYIDMLDKLRGTTAGIG